MGLNILLLDCSSTLEEKLKRQGFDVASGTMGYASRYRHLPSPFYEHQIIVYNPYWFSATDPNDGTPLIKPDTLRGHVLNGAVCLVFLNHLGDSLANLNIAYGWLPFMPPLDFTMDFKPVSVLDCVQQVKDSLPEDVMQSLKDCRPLLSETGLKTPVRVKMNKKDYGKDRIEVIPLFLNRQGDVLGAVLEAGSGKLILMPQYQDNESLIYVFLNRVLPRIFDAKGPTDVIDTFLSPDEHSTASEIQRIQAESDKLDEELEKAKERRAEAERMKGKKIRSDETASFLINYLKQAQQQDDVALFYLYKIIEILEKKFGNESAAKTSLGCKAEWNLIGRVANASYADIRHAPRPGEKIKEWSEEDIKKCFEGAEKIIHAYFSTLF